MRYIILPLVLAVSAFAQAAPTITNITNAAIPTLNYPPSSVHLAPRSMATIFGVNLSDAAISAVPPWQQLLGGIEVLLVASSVSRYDPQQGVTASFPSTEEFITSLIYVSPNQINFVVPDVDPTALWSTRIVIVKNGVRFDNLFNIISGTGLITIDAVLWGNYNVLYGVGYDCLFSFSLPDSGACGLSWSQGQHRAMLGATTDATSGQLITNQNPIHQGQLITMWLTGVTGLSRDDKTGLLQQKTPQRFAFGVAQYGKDLPGTVSPGEFGEYGQFVTVPSLWVGESPEYMGLDQANVPFPICTDAIKATAERRYDAFLTYTNVNTYTGSENDTTVRVYVPFVVRVGDPDCHWTLPLINTNTTLTSSVNPSLAGQAVTVTATVIPSAATGNITFFDGSSTLGTATLSGGKVTLSTSVLSAGTHSITAAYSGDTTYSTSTSAALLQIVNNSKTNTATTLTSSVNPSVSGQTVTLSATVSPTAATGTITFLDGNVAVGTATLSGGKGTLSTSALSAGTHSITAVYSGDTTYNASTSAALLQTVKANSTIKLNTDYNPSATSQAVNLTATVSPSAATGVVTFTYQANGAANLMGSGTLIGGTATCCTSGPMIKIQNFQVGSYPITASYSGDKNYGNSSTAVTQVVMRHNTMTTITSYVNPSQVNQQVSFTATVSASPGINVQTNASFPYGGVGTITVFDGSTVLCTGPFYSPGAYGGCQYPSIPVELTPGSGPDPRFLSVGVHSITARYSGDNNANASSSAALTQIVTAH